MKVYSLLVINSMVFISRAQAKESQLVNTIVGRSLIATFARLSINIIDGRILSAQHLTSTKLVRFTKCYNNEELYKQLINRQSSRKAGEEVPLLD